MKQEIFKHKIVLANPELANEYMELESEITTQSEWYGHSYAELIGVIYENGTKKSAFKRDQKSGNFEILDSFIATGKLMEDIRYKEDGTSYTKYVDDPQCKPLSFWTEQDILKYLKITGIPYCSVYGEIIKKEEKLITTGERHTGCIFCLFGVEREKEPNRFQRLKEIDPAKYSYCIGGGELDQDGKLIPNKKGLGEGKILDFMGVPY